MNSNIARIADRLRQKRDETLEFFESLPEAAWGQQVYDIGPEWDVRQILSHFVAAERRFTDIFEAAMQSDTDVPEDFDIDAFNAESVAGLKALAPADLLDAFKEVRAGTLGFLESITDHDLGREAWHPWFGWDKLEKFIKLVYRHNMLHERDIRRALETGAPVPSSED